MQPPNIYWRDINLVQFVTLQHKQRVVCLSIEICVNFKFNAWDCLIKLKCKNWILNNLYIISVKKNIFFYIQLQILKLCFENLMVNCQALYNLKLLITVTIETILLHCDINRTEFCGQKLHVSFSHKSIWQIIWQYTMNLVYSKSPTTLQNFDSCNQQKQVVFDLSVPTIF